MDNKNVKKITAVVAVLGVAGVCGSLMNTVLKKRKKEKIMHKIACYEEMRDKLGVDIHYKNGKIIMHKNCYPEDGKPEGRTVEADDFDFGKNKIIAFKIKRAWKFINTDTMDIIDGDFDGYIFDEDGSLILKKKGDTICSRYLSSGRYDNSVNVKCYSSFNK